MIFDNMNGACVNDGFWSLHFVSALVYLFMCRRKNKAMDVDKNRFEKGGRRKELKKKLRTE